MNRKRILLLFFLIFSTVSIAQSITGHVKNTEGKPLHEAIVQVLGKGVTIKTAADGSFSIAAQEGDILQFSATNHKATELKVGLITSLEVVLQPASAEEAEAGALGVKRDKNAVGYTTQKAKADQGLSGNVAGVQTSTTSSMGGNTNVTIRGVGSITGSNQPLIVIDGVPMAAVGDEGSRFGDATGDINPEDIESVTVLSGGAATALYGSRGGNGVIIYTTKSGRGGKTSIEIKSSVSFEKAYIAPKMQNEFGGGDAPEFSKQVINGREYNIPSYAVDQSWGPRYKNQPYLPWFAFDEKYLPEHYLKEIPWRAPDNDVETFWNTGVNTSNSISVSRSVSATNLRFSLGDNQVTGIVPNTKLQKTNLAFSFNSSLSKRFKSEGGFNYIITTRDNPENSYTMRSPIAITFYTWGQRQVDMKNMERYSITPDGRQRPWNRNAWNDDGVKFLNNAHWIVNKNTSNDKRHRFFGNIGFTYNLTDELYWVGKIYGDIYDLNTESRVAIGSRTQSSSSKTASRPMSPSMTFFPKT